MNSKRQWIGIGGAALLFGGAFAPAFSAPFGVSVNLLYYEMPAYIVPVAAGVALLAAVIRKYQFVLLAGIIAGLASAYVAIVQSPAGEGVFGDFIQWQWGWVLLVLGIGACAFCALSDSSEEDEEQDSSPYDENKPSWRRLMSLAARGTNPVVDPADSVNATPAWNNDEKKCPYCAETIKLAAVKCRFCGSSLERLNSPAGAGDDNKPDRAVEAVVTQGGSVVSSQLASCR